ncbi:MAG: branched-chain amino acid ABC transporter permease [Actinobacteria bacterium]|nr:branched-chain amino acid ABC transporter permease [Actinomycetota bacterium]
MKRVPGLLLTVAIVVVLALIPAVSGKASTRESMSTILMAIALASSLNILLGYTGYVSFGHIVFFGVGGYVGFYTVSQLGWSLWLSVLAGGVAAGLLALGLGKSILHLRGAYFALATIGVNEAMRALVNNFKPFGGPVGMDLKFSVYKEYGGAATALWTVYWAVAAITVIVIVVSYVVKRSKFGLGLLAIREDEDAAEVMGVNAPNAKTWSYVLSAVFPGLIGVLFFFKNGNIEPGDAFRLQQSIELIVMVMLGGFGTVIGPVLGAGVYQQLRRSLLTSPVFKNVQLAVAGLLLLLIILFIPGGAIGWLRKRFPRLRKVLE